MRSYEKATKARTKEHNKRLVLRTIYDHDQISRAEIARLTSLTRPTVSAIVADLIREGLVAEVGQKPSEGGKPATSLSVINDGRCVIGLDLANDEFRGAVVDLRGKIRHRYNASVERRDGDSALQLVFRVLDELLERVRCPVLGIGIGTPGLVNARAGTVRVAIDLEWRDQPLGEILAERYGLPIYVANDCQAAALAEYVFGRVDYGRNLVLIKIGRGVGAGVVIDGRLHHGDGFGAGEIGHWKVTEAGEPCRCGHFGCLETIASEPAILRQAQTIFRTRPNSPLRGLVSDPNAITLERIEQALAQNDEALAAVIAKTGRYLGRAAAALVSTLDIHHIVLAGRMTHFGETLLDPLRREMRQRALSPLAEETEVSSSSLGDDIVILGAAALLLANELGLAN
ncbi:MAG: ROK family transcriptional regulator [Chloroflexi bacterium]|nr:ROK family transcriptional regulator [Chloroflexota bacterium]